MANVKPGYYDDGTGSGAKRWWDGSAWTEQYEQQGVDPEVLWQAVGRPITGIGAGRYKLTKEIFYFEKGTITTKAQQIMTREIHDVDANQSLTQKARSVGTITMHAVRTKGMETILLEDVPDFRNGVHQINAAAQAARDAMRTKEQTQNVNYQGAAPMQQPAAAAAVAAVPAESSAPGPMEQLQQLAGLRDAGILTEEEFTAKKTEILARM